jgi:peptidoglycan/xylan/chitin deacetylase (PgdA/CDA1 family)
VLSNPPPWPDGAACAAAVTFDVDSDSILHLEHPDDGHRRVGAQSWLRYDQVAVPRIVDLFARLGLRQTFFVPSWCAERYPEVVETIAEGGHEVAAHGYLHELAHTLEPERERELIGRSADILERVAGRRPRGWRGPLYTFSDRTAEFLAEEGYAYHSGLMGDDVPYVLSTTAGEIVELPVDWANDDWPQFANTMDLDWRTPTRAPERGYEVFEAELDAALAYGGLWIAVWHPFVSGRPSRLRRLEGLIERARERGAWFAPLEEIAAHVDGLRQSGRWSPRVDRLPYDGAPVRDRHG